MKRLVFGLAVSGLLLVVAPALLNAGEHQRNSMLDDVPADASLNELQTALGQLPLARVSSDIQLVDHCYRRGSYGYRGHHRQHRAYAPYHSYAPRHYSGHGGYGGGYYRPRSSYYGGVAYPRSGFGLYIGF